MNLFRKKKGTDFVDFSRMPSRRLVSSPAPRQNEQGLIDFSTFVKDAPEFSSGYGQSTGTMPAAVSTPSLDFLDTKQGSLTPAYPAPAASNELHVRLNEMKLKLEDSEYRIVQLEERIRELEGRLRNARY